MFMKAKVFKDGFYYSWKQMCFLKQKMFMKKKVHTIFPYFLAQYAVTKNHMRESVEVDAAGISFFANQ